MTLSRLELGFESPWGRQKIKIATYSLLLSNAANPNTKLLEWKSVRHFNTTSEPDLSPLSNNTKTSRQKAVESAKSLSLALSNAVVSVETIQNNEALASFSSPQFPSSKNPNEAP